MSTSAVGVQVVDSQEPCGGDCNVLDFGGIRCDVMMMMMMVVVVGVVMMMMMMTTTMMMMTTRMMTTTMMMMTTMMIMIPVMCATAAPNPISFLFPQVVVSAMMVWILFQKKAPKESAVSPPVAAEASLPEVAITARTRRA